jgi:ATP-binding protein involved in chromosome partitioning
LSLPEEHTIPKIYKSIAKTLDEDLDVLKSENATPPHVRYETGSSLVILRDKSGKEKKIKARTLRQKCQCAACIDEFSGKKLINEESVDKDVFPYKIEPKGNYAVAIVWSDGHKSSIYPYKRLLSEEIPEK